MIEGLYDVKLYPEDGETTTVLNFKRGIISALAVPVLEEDKNKNMVQHFNKIKPHFIFIKNGFVIIYYTSLFSSSNLYHIRCSLQFTATARPTTQSMLEKTLQLMSA